jgi:ribonuclease HII
MYLLRVDGRQPPAGEVMARTTIREQFAQLGVAELTARFATSDPTAAERRALEEDPRQGVRALAARLSARVSRARDDAADLERRMSYERELWAQGLTLVAGCDEAGVSPLAGPVVAAAVILRPHEAIAGVDDSKKLSPGARDERAEVIRTRAVSWAVGMASPEEIDRLNPYHAGLLAMQRALEGLSPRPEHVLMDARRVRAFAVPQTPIVKGDALSLSIGAASILAKTSRDRLMVGMDEQYPGYGFAVHKGYPVAAHVEALRRLGPCPIHRRSFAPVREALAPAPRQGSLFD